MRVERVARANSWQKFRHRAPIDGLRAIAALLVVVFHAEMPGLDNGYVGVDVFFVLSGYLITSLIVREHLVAGRISLMKFYSRRAKRLFPAALTVLLVTAVAYQIFATPLDVYENAPGFIFAALYASNWYFLSRSQDYFAADVSPSPVLHYWSLSVEEQFYLVWPLIVLVLFMIPAVRRKLGPLVLGGFAIAGLATAALIAQQDEMLAYFGTVGRAYQLLFGATLAVSVLWWQRRRDAQELGETLSSTQRSVGVVLTWAGVVGLIYTATNLGPESPFIVGVVGAIATVLVLLGIELSPRGVLAGWLSSKPAKYLGRWSYSIYLWHWPVIVLLGVTDTLPESWLVRVPLVVVSSVLLAAATWHLVENPVLRLRVVTFKQMRAVVIVGAVATVSAALLTVAILQVPESTQRLAAEITTQDGADALGPKVAGSEDPERTILVIGDSHAPPWSKAMTSYAQNRRLRVVSVSLSACPWMRIAAISKKTGKDRGCEETLRKPALAAAREHQPDLTILLSRSITVRRIATQDGFVDPGGDGWSALADTGIRSFLADLEPLSESIVMIEPIPETETSQPECLSTGAAPATCDQAPKDSPIGGEVADLMRAAATGSPALASVSLESILCPNGNCPAEVAGIVTHRDVHHITRGYAEHVFPQFKDLLRKSGAAID